MLAQVIAERFGSRMHLLDSTAAGFDAGSNPVDKTSMKQISEMHGAILPEKAQTYTSASIWRCIISTGASEAVSDQHHSDVKFELEQKP
jgi:hypothetical protein